MGLPKYPILADVTGSRLLIVLLKGWSEKDTIHSTGPLVALLTSGGQCKTGLIASVGSGAMQLPQENMFGY